MTSKAQKYVEGFIARGFTPVQAAVLAGNFKQESGFNPEAYNPKEDAYGGIQWRLDRKTGLEAYAKATGRKASDPEAQMDWLVTEMSTPGPDTPPEIAALAGREAANAAAFLAAQDPATANKALKKFIRYGDNSEATRLNNALGFMGQGGNALTTEPVQQVAENRCVNPAFGNAPMPDTTTWAPQQPAAAPTTTLPQPAPLAPPDQMAPDDEALLNSFLSVGQSAATQEQPVQSDDEDLLRAFLPTTPGEGELATPPAGLNPGSKEYADWAVEQAKAGKTLPQVSAVPEERAPPTGLMDKIGAGAASYMEAMPVLGPAWLGAAEQARALVHGTTPEAVRAETEAAQAANPLTSATAGVAGTVLPLLAGGMTTVGGRLLGVTGSLPSQIGMGAASNALLSGADTLARGGTVEQAGQNALLGGAIGGAAPLALKGLGMAGNALLGKTSPEVAQLAQAARDKFGIPLGPGQISESPAMRFADSVVNKMPFSGGTASAAQQQTAFNKAVASTFGETANNVTPDVMSRASSRIGQMFEDVAAKTPTIAADPAFDQGILDVMTNAQMALTDQQMAPLTRQFDNIVGKFQQGNGAITGKVYQELTKKGAPLWDAMHSADPGVKTFAGRLRDVIDDAFERSASPEALATLREARSQWKAMRTVENLVEKAPTGDISPALLMGAVRGSYDNLAYGAGGDLYELSRVGQQFLKSPPSSGTAERLAVMNMLTKVGGPAGIGAAAIMNPGSIPMMLAAGIPAGAAYLAAAKGAGAALRSEGLANKLIANSLGVAANPNQIRVPNALLRAITGGAAQKREPIQIEVRGGGNSLTGQ